MKSLIGVATWYRSLNVVCSVNKTTMQISLFHGARDSSPKTASFGSWEKFVQALLPHEFRPVGEKLSCDAYSPALFRSGGRRCNADVVQVSMFVADLDAVSDEQLESFVDAAVLKGWAMVLHTTWSHHEKPNCMRALLPFRVPVRPADWKAVWSAVNEQLGSICDPQCNDPAHLYFGAYAPDLPEAREAAFWHVYQGAFIDPSELDVAHIEAPEQPDQQQRTRKITREEIQRYATKLAKKDDGDSVHLANLLRKVIKGESFAEAGKRDETVFKLASLLGRKWPDADPEALAQHFAPSLQLMAAEAPNCPDVALVAYKLGRAQDWVHDIRQKEDEQREQKLRDRISDAFGNGRSDPYTEEELRGLSPNRWAIQRGRSFYYFVLDRYRGPYVMEEAANAAYRDLSPAQPAGIELVDITARGNVRYKTAVELVRQYGAIANSAALDLTAKKSYFDEETKTIVEATCPLRNVEPVYHEEIQFWLEALAGDRLHLLLSWIAAVTLLRRPCTALLLTGPKHTGKSLLPDGLSKLWTSIGSPTPLADVIGSSFNDAQLYCPLVFGDERLPTDYAGRVLYSELREFIQSRRRVVRRKFLPPAHLVGSVRVVVSANNEDILSTAENLSSDDVGAIADRWLHVPCHLPAYDYLRSIDTTDWVERDKIAQHALFLRDRYEWEPNGRFLVHGDDEDFHSRLISRVGVRSSVLQFLVAYLLSPELLNNDPRGAYWVRVNKGRLCVNVRGIVACWGYYVTNERCPSTGRLSRAISTLAEPKRIRLMLPDGNRASYRVIEKSHLISWAEDKDYAAGEEIEESLSKSTEERMKGMQLRAVT